MFIKSVLERKRLLQEFRTVVDVPWGGNCEYHVLINLLISAGLVLDSSNITDLQKGIHEYATKKSGVFIGKKKLGTDSVFVRSNGDYGYPSVGRKGSEPIVVRERIFRNEVISGIYSKSVDFSDVAPLPYWMQANYVLPIVMHLYKVDSIVVYSVRPTNSSACDMGRKKFTFFTDIYSYNPNSTVVTFTSFQTLKKNSPPASFHFIYWEKEKHYESFKQNG